MFTERVIDTVTHYHSGRQMLFTLLRCWGESKDDPVILLAMPGEAEARVNALRIALSKERAATGTEAFYGMSVSEPFRWTVKNADDGVAYRLEAVVIYWRQSKQQKVGYAVHRAFVDTMKGIN